MIRRITKNNDLKDIIRSIPSDVINNIEEVRYYVYGYEDKFIAPEFTQEGDILKVIIPAEDLDTLPDGLLYRQCFYTKNDEDYPDGEYNLSITDNLELWIYSKENSVQPPIGSNYLQEDDLKTINGESLVGKGDIVIQTTAENIECGPVSNSLFNFSNVNEGLIQIADSVEEINNTKENKKPVFYIDVDFDGPAVLTSYNDYLTIGAQIKQLGVDNVVLYVRDISGIMYMPSCVDFNNNNTMTIGGYGDYFSFTKFYYYILVYNNNIIRCETGSLVNNSDLAHNTNGVQTWVVNQNYAKKTEIPDVSGYALKTEIPSLTGYATETWVESKGYLTEHQSLADYALKSEIPSLDGYVQGSNLKTINGESIVGSGDIVIQGTGGVTEEWVNSQGYATETWVSNQGYLTEHQSLAGYALKSEIPDVSGYALKTEIPDVSGYALKSEIPSLTGYATESWVTNQGYATQTYVDNKIGQIDTLLDQMLG